MTPDSASTSGSAAPSACMLRRGDLPRGWIFLNSGGASMLTRLYVFSS